MTDMTKAQYAKSLFMSGFNCSQSVAAAFADEMGMDKAFVAQLTIGFGGGVGRMREVCGTVTGMTFVISALYKEDKGSIYARVQEVAEEFKKENGSIVCRELLGLDIKGADSPVPEKRTQQYYQKRPCAELVEMAADILDNYLKSHPYK
ncbi:MAG: C-GCAxxG-C-C family protein [Eubacteriales bacterium]|nr:C-GCAxxG-C-C family protein [Eubacteriales bacterium]